jgi:hypothetical protein
MAKALTETEIKLRDAGVQMKLAVDSMNDEAVFRSCINAYIATARSVTMVMEKESAEIPELREWYKKQTDELGQLPLWKFFNNRRVHSIHKASIKLNSHSREIWDLSINGGEPSKTKGVMEWWTFDNVNDFFSNSSGNVIRLCDQYFRSLCDLVKAWLYEIAKRSDVS